MSSFDYSFDEVPVTLPNGELWYATGEFSVSYRMERADPSVGIFRPYAEDIGIADDRVTLELFDAETGGERNITMIVGGADRIVDEILVKRLDYIREAAVEHARAEWDDALADGYTTRRRWF